ncbi:hypothetical protein GCM10020219_026860 [Nonomuraea dietziae]
MGPRRSRRIGACHRLRALVAGTPEERDSGTQAPRKAVSIEGVELGRNGEATKPRWAVGLAGRGRRGAVLGDAYRGEEGVEEADGACLVEGLVAVAALG